MFEYQLGQSAWNNDYQYPPSASSICLPQGIALAPDSTMFVASFSENRVLIFPPMTSTPNYQTAIGVLGQSNFTTGSPGPSLAEMNSPYGVTYDSATNSLWVADAANNRILYFPNILVLPIQLPTTQVSFFGNSPTILLSAKGELVLLLCCLCVYSYVPIQILKVPLHPALTVSFLNLRFLKS